MEEFGYILFNLTTCQFYVDGSRRLRKCCVESCFMHLPETDMRRWTRLEPGFGTHARLPWWTELGMQCIGADATQCVNKTKQPLFNVGS